MDSYDNIFLLDRTVLKLPENSESVKEQIICMLKENNFSITDSAILFKGIINELGKTPMNEL
jgi:hypothetical protein